MIRSLTLFWILRWDSVDLKHMEEAAAHFQLFWDTHYERFIGGLNIKLKGNSSNNQNMPVFLFCFFFWSASSSNTSGSSELLLLVICRIRGWYFKGNLRYLWYWDIWDLTLVSFLYFINELGAWSKHRCWLLKFISGSSELCCWFIPSSDLPYPRLIFQR